MRKLNTFLFVTMLFAPLLGACNAKNATPISFALSEYDIHSGDKVTISQDVKGVTYSFIDLKVEGINLDNKSGLITYSNVPNNTQVLYTAKAGNRQADPVVLTLLSEVEVPTLEFVDISDYLCNQ